jgi:PKD repeat protein
MTRILRLITLAVLLAIFAATANAQSRRFNLDDPAENFYDTQKRLNAYFKKHERELKEEQRRKAEGKMKPGDEQEQELAGYELYKRWEYFMEPRVYPSGDKTLASKAYEEYQKYLEENAHLKGGTPNTIQSTTWTPVGPFGDPSGGNAGRVNAVRFDPASSTGIWSCAPDGGAWKSANNGGSWSTTTDQLSVIGTSDIAFDPTNSQIVYLAMGDADASDCYSIGVLKSTNGGTTWSSTGLSWAVSLGRRIYKMIINPLNKNVLLLATSNGIYRTTNAGTSWAVVAGSGTKFTDIEYKPGDTTTVYACTASTFYKSTNGGASFSTGSTGLPASGATSRLAIAVTAANPAIVYVVGSDASSDGFYGLYQSTNSGASFTQQSSSPNLLGWSSSGGDSGGQGWYTLSIAASPTNANQVVVGGVNIWKSTDGGVSWTISGHWTGSGAPYVHADIHDLIYRNGTQLYAGTDGGVFYSSNAGTNWSSVNGAMNIAQMYKMGLSASNANLIITGHQDNGTNLYTGGWSEVMGGDGMCCFIDWNNNNTMYAEYYNGSFNRSTNGGGSWSGITSGLTGSGPWVTAWHQDPLTANTLYAGYQQMFKSTNQGSSWTQIGTLSGSGSIVEFAVAPSNAQVIYTIKGNAIHKTTNGGTSWTNITGTLPTSSAQMRWIAVKDIDPNTVYVCFSGYSSGNKVYMSTNGGTNWTNYSTGLPNLPANCITYWNGSNDGVYVGCDVGVYYRDASMSAWVAYNTGLPNVAVSDLAIYYPTGKLRAATYGRGVYEVDLYNNGAQAPIAAFTADKTVVCPGMQVNFTDQSTFAPTGWSWVFQGGTPATSSAQNPSVAYNTPGTYSVQLTASNGNGSDVEVKTTYITVSPVSFLPLAEGFQSAAFPPANWQNYDGGADNIIWERNTSVGKASTASMYLDNYTLNSSGARDEMRTPKYDLTAYTSVKLYFDVAYAQYDATYSDTLGIFVSGDCGVTWNQAYLKGGTTLATAPSYTAAMFVPTASQWRTDTVYLNSYAGQPNVMVAFQNRGYWGQALYVDNINLSGSSNTTGIATLSSSDIRIYPNPNNGNFTVQVPAGLHDAFDMEIRSTLGQLVHSERIRTEGQALERNITLPQLSTGVYTVIIWNERGKLAQKLIIH